MKFYTVKYWDHCETTCESCMEAQNEYLVRRAEGFRDFSPYADGECSNCERRQHHKRQAEPTVVETVDSRPGYYYVSVMNDSNEVAFLAGPYTAHSEALGKVAAAKIEVRVRDPRAHWYAYGTCRTEIARLSALGVI